MPDIHTYAWLSSIISSRHPLGLENVFCWFVTKTKQNQALPRHFDGKIWPHSTQFWLWDKDRAKICGILVLNLCCNFRNRSHSDYSKGILVLNEGKPKSFQISVIFGEVFIIIYHLYTSWFFVLLYDYVPQKSFDHETYFQWMGLGSLVVKWRQTVWPKDYTNVYEGLSTFPRFKSK